MPPTTFNTLSTSHRPTRRRSSRNGCILGSLIVLVLLLLFAGAGWSFVLRPYLHNIAQTQIDQAMADAIQQIPPQAVALPPGTLPVQESTFNNLVVLNIPPSSPITNIATSITPDGIRLGFQLYGYSCAIAARPTISKGQLVASNVTVEGIISLILSPDEVTVLLNNRLAEAQGRLKHNISSVILKEKEMDLTLGPPTVILP